MLGIVVTGSPGISQAVHWNLTLGRTFNPWEAFRAVPLTALTSAAAAIAAVLALTNVKLRWLELASAHHIGVTRPDLVGIALAETTLWLVPGCAFALTALAFLSACQNPDPFLAAWVAGSFAGILGGIGGFQEFTARNARCRLPCNRLPCNRLPASGTAYGHEIAVQWSSDSPVLPYRVFTASRQ